MIVKVMKSGTSGVFISSSHVHKIIFLVNFGYKYWWIADVLNRQKQILRPPQGELILKNSQKLPMATQGFPCVTLTKRYDLVWDSEGAV